MRRLRLFVVSFCTFSLVAIGLQSQAFAQSNADSNAISNAVTDAIVSAVVEITELQLLTDSAIEAAAATILTAAGGDIGAAISAVEAEITILERSLSQATGQEKKNIETKLKNLKKIKEKLREAL